MKKIIILIAALACFGWSKCKLVDYYYYESESPTNYRYPDSIAIKHFDFICNIDYISHKNKSDSIKYTVTIKDSEIISIWQIIYSSEARTITVLFNNSMTTFTKDNFNVETERYSYNFKAENFCKDKRITIWNKLKKCIPVKDGKIFFPINNY